MYEGKTEMECTLLKSSLKYVTITKIEIFYMSQNLSDTKSNI